MATTVHVDRDAVGTPRDLGKEFVNADAKKTPFITWIPKSTKPINSLIEQPVEKFGDVTTDGVADEADPQGYTNPRDGDAILNCRVQTWERAGRLGGRVMSVTNQPGITPRDALAVAIAKTMIELKRNMEATVLSNNESAVQGSGTATADATRGLGKWIQSTAQSHYAVDSNYLTPSGSIDSSTATADYTDKTVTTVLKSIYDEHGDGEAEFDIWAGSTWKQQIDRLTIYSRNESNMTQVRRWNSSDETKVSVFVDMFSTSFGTARVRCANFINTGTGSNPHTSATSKLLAYVTLADYLELRMSQTPKAQDLAKTGRSERYLTWAEGALVVKNPRVLGKFAPSA